MTELKKMLSARGYDLTKNSRRLNTVTKRPVYNETLTTRHYMKDKLNEIPKTKCRSEIEQNSQQIHPRSRKDRETSHQVSQTKTRLVNQQEGCSLKQHQEDCQNSLPPLTFKILQTLLQT